ncbi:cell division protein FtsA [Kiloniella laminariae]|uniref:Cell division protein FtsA n=1 Tax=Kiloniella laminariae TaxID=454162 RepID=A0ABT4LDV7_9PROT|nr:cell division protein FtsA [Kiloniella laminariae]MCZ4279288.1 cell division protein FtsA [Kiloniella laminariae]
MKRPLGAIKHGTVAVLDVGSSKICCFIAQMDGDNLPKVIGIGQQASHGMKSGNIVNMETLEDSILNAVHAAEQMAGETVNSVFVNLSGGNPSSHNINLEISINGHEVTESDLTQALEHASQVQGPAGNPEQGRQLIHSMPTGYTLDGNRGIKDPRGMHGETLGVTMHLVTAASNSLRNLKTCIKRCHLDPLSFVLSPFASGLACLVEDEMELGVTLVDMGGSTTSIAVFSEGKLVYCDVIPVGGHHVTNDVARGLSTPVVEAERMKTLYGHAVATVTDEREMIDVPQVGEAAGSQPQQVPRSLLVGIIQPRLEETFEIVRSKLEMSGFDKIGGRRVVLTGGASQLPGLPDLASLILDKQVRIGRPIRVTGLADATGGPSFATCAGLLTYATIAHNDVQGEKVPEVHHPQNFVGRFGRWFRENF